MEYRQRLADLYRREGRGIVTPRPTEKPPVPGLVPGAPSAASPTALPPAREPGVAAAVPAPSPTALPPALEPGVAAAVPAPSPAPQAPAAAASPTDAAAQPAGVVPETFAPQLTEAGGLGAFSPSAPDESAAPAASTTTMSTVAPLATGAASTGVAAGTKGGAPGWMARNEQWLIPLVAGLGTMASSPSRYAGSAFLQGLGGAGSAYETMRTKMADRGTQEELARKTRFDADTVLQDLAQGALHATAPGYYAVTVYNNGTPRNLSLTRDQIASGRYLLTAEAYRAARDAGTVPPAIPAEAAQATQTINADLMQRGRAFGVTNNVMPALQAEVNRQADSPTSDENDNKIMSDTINAAASNRNTQNMLNELTEALMDAPTGTWAETGQDIVKKIGGILKMFGIPSAGLENTASPTEFANKLKATIATQPGVGARSVEHLQTILASLPATDAAPEAKAAGMASALVANQRQIDLAGQYNWARDWAQSQGGLGAKQMSGFGRGLPAAFDAELRKRSDIEQEVLKSLINTHVFFDVLKSTRQGKFDDTIPGLAKVIKGKYNMNDDEAIAFAKGLRRYFQPR
jgi:hypothetical protein